MCFDEGVAKHGAITFSQSGYVSLAAAHFVAVTACEFVGKQTRDGRYRTILVAPLLLAQLSTAVGASARVDTTSNALLPSLQVL